MELETTWIKRGRLSYLTPIRKLLGEAEMPTKDLVFDVDNFKVLYIDGVVNACGGLENHGRWCLLRSLVVRSEYRSRGHGSMLLKALIEEARSSWYLGVVALMPTNFHLLQHVGFVQVDRETIDPKVRTSWQFSEPRYADAACMQLVFKS